MAMKIGLVQAPATFKGQRYLPYSVGCLQAYAMRNAAEPQRFEFLLPVFDRISVKDAVAQLWNADIVAISSYVWGEQLSLEYARVLKHFRPSIGIIMGGPQAHSPWIPNHARTYLEENPFIDMLIEGEGEQPFVSILENAYGDWEKIPSIFFVKDGVFHQTRRCERMPSLVYAPSPYLEGVFDPLMREYPQIQWIATYETDRGCPYACTMCGWGGKVHQKVYTVPIEERVFPELEWFGEHKILFVVCANANFGFKHKDDPDRDVKITRHVVEVKKRYGWPGVFSIQSAKNAPELVYEIHKILYEADMARVITVALQSTDSETLKNTKRGNIKQSAYREIVARARRDGIPTSTDIIMNLPGETYHSFRRGCAQVMEDGGAIQLNSLIDTPDAELSNPAYQKKFGIETVVNRMLNFHAEAAGEGISYIRLEDLPRENFSSDAQWINASIRETGEEIYEKQKMVIATASMPREDFVRAKAFGWMMMFLYYGRILAIPFILLHKVFGLKYEDLISHFSDTAFDPKEYPIVTGIQSLFREKAEEFQQGGDGCEFFAHNGIWWLPNEYAIVSLVGNGKLDAFYREAEKILSDYAEESGADVPTDLFEEAVGLNRELLKLPDRDSDLDFELSYNLGEFFTGALELREAPLEKRPSRYQADRTSKRWNFERWCVEVIWWMFKSSDYLYAFEGISTGLSVDTEGLNKLSGHY